MDFTLTADQTALTGAIDKLATQFETKPTDFHGFALSGNKLDAELENGGYFDIANVPELGPLTAAMAVERLAWLPCTAEVALSMLVGPQLAGGELPRPFAIIENGRPGRFVAGAKTLLIIDSDSIAIAHPTADMVETVDSLYAYPMGRLKIRPPASALSAVDAANARTWLRIALAAETSGLLHAAIASTVEHLSIRKQFGRPLGTFQALRHRMAECTVLAGGVLYLSSCSSDGSPPPARAHVSGWNWARLR